MSLPKIIAIIGPTASGKTCLSLDIAQTLSSSIISADSRQVYRHMDIGTAKERGRRRLRWYHGRFERPYMVAGVAHYLIDILDPKESWSVAAFQEQASKYIERLHQQGQVPIIAGGTGLYVQALIDNYALSGGPAQQELRDDLADASLSELQQMLRTDNPDVTAHIDMNNPRRVLRAIEIARTQSPTTETDAQLAQRYDTLLIGLRIEREVLYTRINERVDQMIADGLMAEIQTLLERGYTWDDPGMTAIGYRQFQPFFEARASLESCIDVLKRDTRRYAKRQLTWWRRDDRVVWCDSQEQAMEQVNIFLET